MDFEFSEEQKLTKKAAEEFCQKEVLPYIDKWLKSKVFPRELMKKCASIGWTGMNIKEEYGGTPLNNVSQGIITEVIGRYEVPTQILLSLQLSRMLNYTSEECREKFVKKFLGGDLIICGGFTEPCCGSDSAAITTRAVRDGLDYLVCGEKAFISGPLYSDIFIISAKTAEIADKPHKAISLIIVEKDRDGVEPYELETMAPGFKGDFGGVKFDDARVPVANLVGEENKGFHFLMSEFNIIRVHVALMALGAAEKSIE
ncbi:MAG: acyl-CoA/acyl-ACP dehydrogenase, partial [Candidatus Bathyarchaeota archaeon]|nr:acyl-CoA/acyl-ACP dehydrogenase [Candidatus Bathyarchaeota archaeon]